MRDKTLIVLSLASFLLAACSAGTTATPGAEVMPTVIADNSIIAEGQVEPVHFAQIAFTTSGEVDDILIQEGQEVKQGDELIHLGDASDTHYAAAQLELASAKQALAELSNTAGTDLAQAVIDLKDAQEEYDKAVHYLAYLQNTSKVAQTETRTFLVQTWRGYEYRTRTKHFKGPAPEDWIIEAENDLALKKARLDVARRAYDRLKDGIDVEQLTVVEARLEAAEAGLAAFAVKAPFDGVIADVHVRTGSSIQAGEPAITIADFSQWVVKTTDLTEIDVVKLGEGQVVLVTLDALPDVELAGQIVSIGQTFTQNQGDIVYEVTVLLSDVHPAMRWGMTATVHFEPQD